MPQNEPRPTAIVSVCAPSDIQGLEQWEAHLHPLEQTGSISVWSVRHLPPGADRLKFLQDHLDQADFLVLLLSADFFSDDECMSLMERALARHQQGTVRVIPLLLRPVSWRETKLAAFAPLPSDKRPVTLWENPEAAFDDCVRHLRRLLGRPVTAPLVPQQIPPTKQASLVQIKKPWLKLSSERRKIGGYDDALKHPYPFKKPLLLLGMIVLVVLLSMTSLVILFPPRIFFTPTSAPTSVSTPVPLWHDWPAVRSDAFQDPEWEVNSTGDYPWCQFVSPSYTYEEQSQGHNYCNYGESAHHHWADVALSMEINIKQGEWGGSIIRLQQGAYYDFHITTSGSYELIRHLPDNQGQDYTVTSGTSSAIHRGYDVWNTLTFGVKGTTFQLWVNGHYLTTATDNIIQWGTIGVTASYGQQSDALLTLVQFRHAQVWLSPEEPYSI